MFAQRKQKIFNGRKSERKVFAIFAYDALNYLESPIRHASLKIH